MIRLPTGQTRPIKTRDKRVNTTHSMEEVGSMHTTRMTKRGPSNSWTQEKDPFVVKEEAGIGWGKGIQGIDRDRHEIRCRY